MQRTMGGQELRDEWFLRKKSREEAEEGEKRERRQKIQARYYPLHPRPMFELRLGLSLGASEAQR